jgi:hypothetical protein
MAPQGFSGALGVENNGGEVPHALPANPRRTGRVR